MIGRLRSLLARYREMATDVAWSGISDLLNLLVNLVSFLLLARSLEVATYGGYVGVFGVIAPLGALTWSGLTLLVLQRIIREGDDLTTVAHRAYMIATAQGVAAAALATAIGRAVIDPIDPVTIALIAIAELVFFPFTQTTATLVQATKGFAAAARLRIVVPIVRFVALVVPFSMGALTVRNLALAWSLGLGILAVGAVLLVLPTLGIRFGLRSPGNDYVRGNLELSLPLTASTFQQNGDKVVMNSYGLEVDAGLYGAAYRIILLSQLPIRTMNQALFQRFLPDNVGDLGQHVRRAKRFSMVSLSLSLVICAGLFVVAPLLTVLVGDDFAESVTIVRWLLLAVPLLAVGRAPLNGLLGLGRTQLRASLILSSALLSLVLYVSLVPTMSWRGAVIGTIVAELYIVGAGWLLLLRHQRRADDAHRAAMTAQPAAP